jgi:hypothetical protein
MPVPLPDAKYLLSGENERQFTALLCPLSAVISFFYSMLQIFTFLSSLPEAIYLPSGDNAIDLTDL